MKIITLDTVLADLVTRWKRQYPRDKAEITSALEREKPLTKDAADKIIGNSSWTEVPWCDECRKPSEKVIFMGDDTDDYDVRYLCLCHKCIIAANKVFKSK